MKQTIDEKSLKALVNYRLNRVKETLIEVQVIVESGNYKQKILLMQ